jgi:hypothetical protein
MQHGRNRKLKGVAVALVAAALAAPVTQAAVDTDARHQALVDKASQIQVDPHHQALLRHDEQGAPFVYVTTRPESSSSGGGTNWTSAGIGAGAAFGVILVGSAAAFVGRKKLVSA